MTLKFLSWNLANSLIFFAEKMWVLLTFLQQKYQHTMYLKIPYAALTCWQISLKILNLRQNCQMIWLAWKNIEKVRPYECLWNSDVTNIYEWHCKSCKCFWPSYEWNEYTTCACQCFFFVPYLAASTEGTSSFKMSSCYPSSYPGAEEMVVVERQGKVSPSPSWTQRLCFWWCSIQWWPKQDGGSLKRPVRKKAKVICQGCQEAQAREHRNLAAGWDVRHSIRPLSFPHSSPVLSDCTSSFKGQNVYSK